MLREDLYPEGEKRGITVEQMKAVKRKNRNIVSKQASGLLHGGWYWQLVDDAALARQRKAEATMDDLPPGEVI